MGSSAAGEGLEGWGLVVVDMQNDFLSAAGYYARRTDLDERLSRGSLTAEARNQLLLSPGTAPAGGLHYRVDALQRIVANVVRVIEHARAQQRPIAYLQAAYSRSFEVQPPFLHREPEREHYACKPATWGMDLVDPIRQLALAGASTSREALITKHTFDGFFQTGLREFLHRGDVRSVVLVGVETHVCVLKTAQSASIHQFEAVILEDCVWTANPALGRGALAIFRDAFGSTALASQLAGGSPDPGCGGSRPWDQKS